MTGVASCTIPIRAPQEVETGTARAAGGCRGQEVGPVSLNWKVLMSRCMESVHKYNLVTAGWRGTKSRTEYRSKTGNGCQCASSIIQNQKAETWSKVQPEVSNTDEQQT